MYQVEDEPVETIHLYVVREKAKRPPLIPLVVSLLALSTLIALGVSTSYQQPETRVSLRVPAVPSFTKTYSAEITVVPTGIKTYPATFAHGVLTIQNGSVIGQMLPAGFAVSGVATDRAVYVAGATADGFAVAVVTARALVAGANLPALAVNQVIGTSLFIRNLSAFTGGHAAYSVKFVTSQDRVRAITQARAIVAAQITGLHYPCRETISTTLNWRCQFVTYHIPSYMRVTNVMLQGSTVLVNVIVVARPKHIWVK